MNLSSRVKSFSSVMEDVGFGKALGGRSMGARAAVMAATEETEKLVLVSYPLVSAKGDVRDEILVGVGEGVDVLFVVGGRDAMCPRSGLREVRARMKARSWVVVVEGADHGMGVKPKAATEEMVRETGRVAAEWLEGRGREERERTLSWDAEEGRVSWSAGVDWGEESAKGKGPTREREEEGEEEEEKEEEAVEAEEDEAEKPKAKKTRPRATPKGAQSRAKKRSAKSQSAEKPAATRSSKRLKARG